MAYRELREWLGLTWADLIVYSAAGAVVAMFHVNDPTAVAALAKTGVTLAVAACPLGMRPDPGVSRLTNFIKLMAYPACVLLAVGAVVVRYVWFAP